jgi:hypothetical protein
MSAIGLVALRRRIVCSSTKLLTHRLREIRRRATTHGPLRCRIIVTVVVIEPDRTRWVAETPTLFFDPPLLLVLIRVNAERIFMG